MADQKISALGAYTTPIATDVLPIVDVTTGTTKKITLTNLVAGMTAIYPVGSIYMNASASTNPATLFGFGTWAAFGAGKVLVGLNAAETEFDTLGETGGAKTHQLSVAEMPAHSHNFNVGQAGGGNTYIALNASTPVANANQIANKGGDTAHNNLQPYITVYMWQRTA